MRAARSPLSYSATFEARAAEAFVIFLILALFADKQSQTPTVLLGENLLEHLATAKGSIRLEAR